MVLVCLHCCCGVSPVRRCTHRALLFRALGPHATLDRRHPQASTTFDQPSGTFTIDAGGSDIWGTSDKFHFVYQQVSGDVDVVARVDSITQADQWSKSGVMIRASLPRIQLMRLPLSRPRKASAFQRRTQNRRHSTNTAGSSATAPLLGAPRSGGHDQVTAYVSSNGTSWTSLGSDTIALGTSAYVGIATTSHNSSATTSVESLSCLDQWLTID